MISESATEFLQIYAQISNFKVHANASTLDLGTSLKSIMMHAMQASKRSDKEVAKNVDK